MTVHIRRGSFQTGFPRPSNESKILKVLPKHSFKARAYCLT